jgi:hypothetical protein
MVMIFMLKLSFLHFIRLQKSARSLSQSRLIDHRVGVSPCRVTRR